MDNVYYGTIGGENTIDKIFLLSVEEVEEYLPKHKRAAQATAYAIGQGLNEASTGTGSWWLRTPGQSHEYAVKIFRGGNIDREGNYVDVSTMSPSNMGVRPAMWISVGKRKEENFIPEAIATPTPTPIPTSTPIPTPIPTLTERVIKPCLEAWETYFSIFAYNSEASGSLPYYEALPKVREFFSNGARYEYVDAHIETCEADTNSGDENIEPGVYVYEWYRGYLVGYMPIEEFRIEYGEPSEEDIFVVEEREEPVIPELSFEFVDIEDFILVVATNQTTNEVKVMDILFRNGKIVEIRMKDQ